MRRIEQSNLCLFGEDLVSYIYDELSSSERSEFEMHLVGCDNCVSELTLVSEPRLGLYEWHRDEFLPLETPVFAIPYERPMVESHTRTHWIEAVRTLFSPVRLALTGGAFAILAIAFGSLYLPTFNSTNLVAAGLGNVDPNVEAAPIESASVDPENAQIVDPRVSDSENKHIIRAVLKPVQKANKTANLRLNKRDSDRRSVIQASVPANAPRLGTYDDAEDTSLRLADLVADIDTDDF